MKHHRLRRLDTGEEFDVLGQVFIGRDADCDIVLDDAEISRRHAVVSVTDEGVVIADNHSTNGVQINGRSSRRGTLSHGQVIQIGAIQLAFLERGRSDDPTIANYPSQASPSFIVDQGSGEDTAFRAGYAPLPGDDQADAPEGPERRVADPADRALLSRLISHHELTSATTAAVLMPLAREPGGLRQLANNEAFEWSLGRGAGCDLVFDHPSVSSEHARLSRRDGIWSLTDLDSTNGTRCNGLPVNETVIRSGDLIEVGNLVLLFDVLDV